MIKALLTLLHDIYTYRASGENDAVRGTLARNQGQRSYAARLQPPTRGAFLTFVQHPIGWITLGDVQAYVVFLGQGGLEPKPEPRSYSNQISALFGQDTYHLGYVGAAVKLRDRAATASLNESSKRAKSSNLLMPPPRAQPDTVKLLYVSGIRVSELLRLQWYAVPQTDGGQITVFGKGRETARSC